MNVIKIANTWQTVIRLRTKDRFVIGGFFERLLFRVKIIYSYNAILYTFESKSSFVCASNIDLCVLFYTFSSFHITGTDIKRVYNTYLLNSVVH